MKPSRLLLYSRPGFERECAQEITALAGEMGVEGFVKARPESAFAVFAAHQDEMGADFARHVEFARLVFPRQMVRVLEPLTLIGYSWGGLLALLFAIEAAHHRTTHTPARLVLIDPAPVTRAYRDQFETEFARLLSQTYGSMAPSLGEGFCGPAAMALGLGKPLITPRHTAFADYVPEDYPYAFETRPVIVNFVHDPLRGRVRGEGSWLSTFGMMSTGATRFA